MDLNKSLADIDRCLDRGDDGDMAITNWTTLMKSIPMVDVLEVAYKANVILIWIWWIRWRLLIRLM